MIDAFSIRSVYSFGEFVAKRYRIEPVHFFYRTLALHFAGSGGLNGVARIRSHDRLPQLLRNFGFADHVRAQIHFVLRICRFQAIPDAAVFYGGYFDHLKADAADIAYAG